MQLNKILTGTFDCRQYKKDTPRNSRPLVEDGGRINLTVGFDESEFSLLDEEIKAFGRKSSKNERYYLTFKVFSKNCKLYTASAKQVEFPVNMAIDGARVDCKVEFSVKHGTGTELNGLYANAIQIIRRADNPFDAIEGGDDDFLNTAPEADPLAAPVEKIAIAEPMTEGKVDKNGLPF